MGISETPVSRLLLSLLENSADLLYYGYIHDKSRRIPILL